MLQKTFFLDATNCTIYFDDEIAVFCYGDNWGILNPSDFNFIVSEPCASFEEVQPGHEAKTAEEYLRRAKEVWARVREIARENGIEWLDDAYYNVSGKPYADVYVMAEVFAQDFIVTQYLGTKIMTKVEFLFRMYCLENAFFGENLIGYSKSEKIAYLHLR